MDKYTDNVFLKEKNSGTWTETTYKRTQQEARKIGAGLISIGVEKGDKIEIESGDSNLYTYEVESINITSKKDSAEVLPTAQQRREGKETLSLISIGNGDDSFVLVRATKQ